MASSDQPRQFTDRRLAAMGMRTPTNRALVTIGTVAVALLASCGGGRGQQAPLPPFPGEGAINSYYQASHHTMLAATDAAGHAYTLQIDQSPSATPVNFHGVSAYSMADIRTLQEAASTSSVSIQSKTYFLLNPFVPVGTDFGAFAGCAICGVSDYEQVTSSFPLPSTLADGDSGPFANMTFYNGNEGRAPTGAIVYGYGSTNYSVTADTTTTKRLCLAMEITSVTADGATLADRAETDCFAISVGGTAALVAVTMIWNGETLTFQ